MVGLDGISVTDTTKADFEGRKRIYAMVDFIRANMPGFAGCYVIDVAPQLGIDLLRILAALTRDHGITSRQSLPVECVQQRRPISRLGRRLPADIARGEKHRLDAGKVRLFPHALQQNAAYHAAPTSKTNS